MSKSTYLILPLLLLAGCGSVDNPETICTAALQGKADPNYNLFDQCLNDIYWAGFKARQDAANKYRTMAR